ncbi:branched-chain amino acid ABC transporter permease [Actinomadura macra]|uniref:branched-chain amino acid ABC transporter permease n=1 Tax=Actinomadura macra TaxID=46164 RepID=UPI000837071E|nr:branched-chain amino acid ABC transporter permease [Actinomadura macra]
MDTTIQLTVTGLSTGSIYLLVGVGLTLIYGVARVTDFAIGQYFVLGGYAALAMTGIGVPFLLTIPIAGAVVGAMAMSINTVVLRGEAATDAAAFLLTLGIAIVLRQVIVLTYGPDQQSVESDWMTQVITLGDVRFTLARLVILVLAIAGAMTLFLLLGRTRLGRLMRATSENPDVARLLGVNSTWVARFSYFQGTSLAAIAGASVSVLFPFTPFTGNDILMKGLAVALAGGLGNIRGALIFAPVLGLLESYTAGSGLSEWQGGFSILLLIAVLAWRPHGLLVRSAR